MVFCSCHTHGKAIESHFALTFSLIMNFCYFGKFRDVLSLNARMEVMSNNVRNLHRLIFVLNNCLCLAKRLNHCGKRWNGEGQVVTI